MGVFFGQSHTSRPKVYNLLLQVIDEFVYCFCVHCIPFVVVWTWVVPGKNVFVVEYTVVFGRVVAILFGLFLRYLFNLFWTCRTFRRPLRNNYVRKVGLKPPLWGLKAPQRRGLGVADETFWTQWRKVEVVYV